MQVKENDEEKKGSNPLSFYSKTVNSLALVFYLFNLQV